MRLNRVIRASEWWEYKIGPVLAAFYGTLFIAGVPVAASWRDALTLLAAIVAEAAYVSVLNDVTDREEDRAAGKPLRDPGPFVSSLLLVASLGVGVLVMYLWRDQTLLVTVYAAGWIAFSLYSLPPFRLKTRGLPGVLCDAAGAHLFPALTAVLLASRGAARQPEAMWLAAVATWAFSGGIRGILWHQLRDSDADRRAGAQTFVIRSGEPFAIRIGTYVAFPLELIALAVMLWRLRSVWPVAALALYLLLILLRPFRWDVRATIVTPRPRSFLLLNEFHDGYLPAAILVASALRYRHDVIILVMHLLLFPKHTLQNVRELAGLVRRPTKRSSARAPRGKAP